MIDIANNPIVQAQIKRRVAQGNGAAQESGAHESGAREGPVRSSAPAEAASAPAPGMVLQSGRYYVVKQQK